MHFQKEIQKMYRENPKISGTEMLEQLRITNPRSQKVFWRELEKIQVSMRGLYPGIRRNTHAHSKSRGRGVVYFIPPRNKGEK